MLNRRDGDRLLRLVPPDRTERRGGNWLLIWGDLPHWMVVDGEFRAFLAKCDGKTRTSELLATIGAADRSAVADEITRLARIGVLVDAERDTFVATANRPTPTPIENISVNLTRRCNLRCSFCYYIDDLGEPADAELSAGEIVELLKAARPFLAKKPSLALLGGEPLLCADKLLEVCRYAARAGFSMLISTNGTVVTPEFARRARRQRLQVQVSLDGHTAKVHDAVRGKGSFARSLAGIRTLVEHKVHTILSMVCHAGNIAHLADYYAFAVAEGVNEARFIPLKRIGGADASGVQPAPLHEMVAATVRMLEQHPEYIRLMGRDCFSIMGTTCRLASRRVSCGTGLQTLLLDSDGEIYPCLNTNRGEFRVGNIRDAGFDFASTWQNSPVLRKVRQGTSVEVVENACSRCHMRHWCLGGCHGETHAVTGELSAPAHNCADQRRALTEMMRLVSEHPEWIIGLQAVC